MLFVHYSAEIMQVSQCSFDDITAAMLSKVFVLLSSIFLPLFPGVFLSKFGGPSAVGVFIALDVRYQRFENDLYFA